MTDIEIIKRFYSDPIRVNVKKLDEKAVLPYKTYERDFCYDVVATSCEEIAPNVWKYGIGLAFEIVVPDDIRHYNLSIDLRPRSSVWKTGMVLSNCEGTIDELFRGGVSAVFYHVLTNMPRYDVGDRIGQIKLGWTRPIEFVEVEELSDSERGDGGYGSTGK
jgi:dUTP pyrophosphatase